PTGTPELRSPAPGAASLGSGARQRGTCTEWFRRRSGGRQGRPSGRARPRAASGIGIPLPLERGRPGLLAQGHDAARERAGQDRETGPVGQQRDGHADEREGGEGEQVTRAGQGQPDPAGVRGELRELGAEAGTHGGSPSGRAVMTTALSALEPTAAQGANRRAGVAWTEEGVTKERATREGDALKGAGEVGGGPGGERTGKQRAGSAARPRRRSRTRRPRRTGNAPR